MNELNEELRPWLTVWAQRFRQFAPLSRGGPPMIESTWDEADARESLKKDAAYASKRLLEMSVSITETGKVGKASRSERYYWQRAVNALAEYLNIPWGTSLPKHAPPATRDQMIAALSWALLEFWPTKGTEIWLDNEFESFLDRNPHDDEF